MADPFPFLDLGNVGLVVERVGGGRREQHVGADLKPKLRRIPVFSPLPETLRCGAPCLPESLTLSLQSSSRRSA